MAGHGHGRGPKPKIQNPGKLMKRLMGYVMRLYGIQMILVAVCIVAGVFASVQGTLFLQTLIDEYILPLLGKETPDFQPLAAAIGRVAIFYGIGVLSAFIKERVMINVTQGTMQHLRKDLFIHMQTLPIKYFDTHAHGDIMSIYTNDIDTFRQVISQSLPQLFNSVITIVSVLVSMIMLNVPLTILSLVMVAVTLFVTKNVAGNSGRYFAQQQRDIGKLNGYIEEMMEGQKVVKVFCHEKECEKEFNELNDQLCDSANNANKFANMVMPLNGQIGNLSYVFCAIVGGILAINGIGGFTLGGLASFLTFNKNFNMPINQVSMQFNSIVMALAGAQRVFELLDATPETDEGYVTLVNVKEENGQLVESDVRTGRWAWKHYHKSTDTTDYVEVKGDVTFDGVDFGYNPDKMVLHDIKMYATPGQKIAFVGSTGAGKTTITNLINRFYDIQDGKIRYDRININKIKKEDLRPS